MKTLVVVAAGDLDQYASITAMLADAFPFVGQLQFETAAARMKQARPQDALHKLQEEPRSFSGPCSRGEVRLDSLLLLTAERWIRENYVDPVRAADVSEGSR